MAPDISIVGVGNTAQQLAYSFTNSGLNVSRFYARKMANPIIIRNQEIEIQIIKPGDSINADLLFLCISDDAIEEFHKEYTVSANSVVHCAGSVSLDAIESAQSRGVFYPIQTLNKNLPLNAAQIPICIEANSDELQTQLFAIANQCGFPAHTMNSQERLHLHLSAVMVNNFSNHLWTLAWKIAGENGMDGNILLPLLEQTLYKFKQIGGYAAQTGPALRNDQTTLDQHKKMLIDKDIADLYLLFSKSIKKLHT